MNKRENLEMNSRRILTGIERVHGLGAVVFLSFFICLNAGLYVDITGDYKFPLLTVMFMGLVVPTVLWQPIAALRSDYPVATAYVAILVLSVTLVNLTGLSFTIKYYFSSLIYSVTGLEHLGQLIVLPSLAIFLFHWRMKKSEKFRASVTRFFDIHD